MTPTSIGGSSALQQQLQAMFAKADLNTDGQLSRDEFQSIGQNLPEPGRSRPARASHSSGGGGENFASATMGSLLSIQESRAAEVFAGADSDGDGTLTAEEMAADMAAHAPPGAAGADTAAMAANFLSKADADDDGVLSMEEFKSAAPKGPRPPPPPAEGGAVTSASTSTDPLDTDGDGKVSMAELLASLQTTDQTASGFSTEASDLLARLIEQLTADSGVATTSLAA